MPTIVTPDEVRDALQLQGFHVTDSQLTSCIDAAEAVILPLLIADVDYSTHENIVQAVTMVACDVYQARMAANGQGMGLDGAVMPFRMGRSLASRVIGLLGPDMDTAGMVG